MKLLRYLSLVLLAMSVLSMAQAQPRTITGTVTSAENGEPLIGVSILIVGSLTGTVTDLDGNYELDVGPDADSLQFSYTGFQTRQVPIAGRSVIDVQLPLTATQLNEVVVIGYGTVRKSDLTGSVYSVKSEELVKNPAANVLQSLQGKVPGVQISSASGNPGESPVVRIRGVSTFLGGASPIFVVDGVILDDISFLNPGDIESVEVLKDASATAIYGTRGANGVIIVTTKRGREGAPVVRAAASYSLESVSNHIDLLNSREFAAIVNEIQPGTFNNVDLLPDTDWQSLIFQDQAPIQQYELSVSGGSERYNYYVGGSYYQQEGVIPKSDYERLSLKLNNTLEAASFLTLGANLAFAKEDKTNPPGVVAAAYRAWPTSAPTDDRGNFVEVQGSGNPMASIAFANNFSDRIRGIGNLYTDIRFLQDFTFRTSFQLDLTFGEGTGFSPRFFVSPTQQNEINDLTKSRSQNQSWIWENTLNYYKELPNHRFSVLLGYTSQETTSEALTTTVENLIRETPDFWYIDAGDATTIDAFNRRTQFSYISYLFRINYTLLDRYLFTGTFRRDGSSKFGPNNRYGNFPSLALGWRITEEAFMDGQQLFDNLKLRASWGINGNDRIPFDARFARVGSNNLEAVFGPNEVLYPGATLVDAGNPDLQWENTETFDVGLEFGFVGGKLSGEVDYYNKRTNEVLVALQVPAHFGNGPFNPIVFNAADVRNQGWEFYLNWRDNAGAFNYGIGMLGSTVSNEVLDIGAADEFIQGGSLGNGQLVTRTQAGLPIGSFFGYRVAGVFQTQEELNQFPVLSGQRVGDLRYEDINGDGVIDPDDRTVLGSYIPDFLMGLNLEFGYRGLQLQLDFQGQFGNEIYNGKRAVRPELYNFESFVLDRWTGPGTSTTQPRLSTGGINYTPSDWLIEDGSFVRLRSASLLYTLPRNLLTKLKLQNGTIFLRGTNVFTLTDFSGYSPEIASQNVLSSGIDLGVYPITTVYTLGLNFSF